MTNQVTYKGGTADATTSNIESGCGGDLSIAIAAAEKIILKFKQQDQAIQELKEQVMALQETIRYLEKRHG